MIRMPIPREIAMTIALAPICRGLFAFFCRFFVLAAGLETIYVWETNRDPGLRVIS